MKHVGVVEASATLSSLLDDVARGEEITILRDGKPAARLLPTQTAAPLSPEFSPEEIEIRREAVRRLRENARQINLQATQEEIKSWIEDGRR